MVRLSSLRFLVVRVLTVLFAVQVVAAGFCLLVPQAHARGLMQAAPVAQLNADNLCAKADSHADDHHAGDMDGCFHCEKPDLATTVAVESPPSVTSAMLLFVMTAVVGDGVPFATDGQLAHHDPGISAGDRALLFHLIPRIRV